MRYFYVSFMVNGHAGAMIIPQDPVVGSLDDGLNIAEASKYLRKLLNAFPVVLSWQETTERRFNDWITMTKEWHAEASGQAPKGVQSVFINDGLIDKTPPKGVLQVVTPDDPKPPGGGPKVC